MGVVITGSYRGKKRVELTHEQSGSTIVTDAPLDNNGEGKSFSPTDLCATSLGTCILTVMAIKAEKSGMPDLLGSHFRLEKIMTENPRRIAEVKIEFHLPSWLSERDRKVLEAVAHSCPVHHSLAHEVQKTISFQYDVVADLDTAVR